MNKTPTNEIKREFVRGPKEMKFDTRLLDKRIEGGFLTHQEFDHYLEQLPEEQDYEFQSYEESFEKEKIAPAT